MLAAFSAMPDRIDVVRNLSRLFKGVLVLLVAAAPIVVSISPKDAQSNICSWLQQKDPECIANLPELAPYLVLAVLAILGLLWLVMIQRQVPRETKDVQKTGNLPLSSANNRGIVTVGQSGGVNMINREPELPPQRVLSAEQKAAIASAIKDRPPGKLVCILNGSKEANQFSRQIESVLKEQGWTVQHFSGPSSRREFDHVRVGYQPVESPAFAGLVKGLSQAGIQVETFEFEMNSDHTVSLDVGAIAMPAYQAAIDKL